MDGRPWSTMVGIVPSSIPQAESHDRALLDGFVRGSPAGSGRAIDAWPGGLPGIQVAIDPLAGLPASFP